MYAISCSYRHYYSRCDSHGLCRYPQDSVIIGPSGLVLGGKPDVTDPTAPVRLLLCPRQAQDAMQLWSWSRGGRLRNKAGYVKETSLSSVVSPRVSFYGASKEIVEMIRGRLTLPYKPFCSMVDFLCLYFQRGCVPCSLLCYFLDCSF